MRKRVCPNCGNGIDKFVVRPSKAEYRWYEISEKHAFCPHCDAQLTVDRASQRWALLILPFVVLGVWNVAVGRHGGFEMWIAGVLAGCGIGMFGLTAKTVMAEKQE